jgi:hypothetical protein
MRFIARPKAPTYPDADHNAVRMPTINAKPADGELTSCSIVGRRVSTADEGATSEAMSRTASVVRRP